MDWCYSASRGAFGGILVMWDRRVVEKIYDCVGEFTVAYSSRNVEDGFSQVSMGLTLTVIGGIYGSN